MALVEQKQKFIQLLKSTNREGIDSIIQYLEKSGFFEAPASTKYHGAYDGGLCEHCLNVWEQAMYLYKVQCKIKPEVKNQVKEESIIISALLHDTCKADIYKKVKKWRKNAEDKWEQYDSYEHDYSNYPYGHGEKSVIVLLLNGLKLEKDEISAIRWHMGSWDLSDYAEIKGCFNTAADQSPLLSIIMAADSLASRVTEIRGIK